MSESKVENNPDSLTGEKSSRLIIVGPSWYGRWVEYIYPEYKKLGVDVEVVYTNNPFGSSSGHTDSKGLHYIEKFKWVLRRSLPFVFNFLKKLKRGSAQKNLLERVSVAKKDGKNLVVMFVWTPPPIELLEKLKSMDVSLVLWQGEHWKREEYWVRTMKYFNHIFCVDRRWAYKDEDTKKKLTILPLASTPESFSPIELSQEDKEKYSCDVVFIGLYKPQRADALSGLKDLDLRVYGHGWEGAEKEFPWLEGKIFGPAALEDMPKIFTGAKISIGSLGVTFSDPENLPNVTQRVFDVALMGKFQLGQYNPQTEEIFGDAIPYFSSKEELGKLTKYYLDNPNERTNLAKKAMDIALNNTWEDRVKESMKILKTLI